MFACFSNDEMKIGITCALVVEMNWIVYFYLVGCSETESVACFISISSENVTCSLSEQGANVIAERFS